MATKYHQWADDQSSSTVHSSADSFPSLNGYHSDKEIQETPTKQTREEDHETEENKKTLVQAADEQVNDQYKTAGTRETNHYSLCCPRGKRKDDTKSAREKRDELCARELVEVQQAEWVQERYTVMIDVMAKEIDEAIEDESYEAESGSIQETAAEEEHAIDIKGKRKKTKAKNSAKDSCTNCCCRPAKFTCCSPILRRFRCYKDGTFDKTAIPDSKSVQRAISLGWKGIKSGLDNLYTDTPLGAMVREFGSYIGFLVALGFLIASIVNLVQDQVYEDDPGDDAFLIATVVLGTVGIICTSFDISYQAYHRRCQTCQKWKQWYKEKRKSKHNLSEELIPNSDREEEGTSSEPDPEKCCEEKCVCWAAKYTKAFDVARLAFTEMLFYPNVVLSIFQFLTNYVHNDCNAMEISVASWLQLVFSFGGTFFSVYVVRAFILAGSVYTMVTIRDVKLNGIIFHLAFVCYAYGTMVMQILMIISIGACYYSHYVISTATENYCLNSTTTDNSTVDLYNPNDPYGPYGPDYSDYSISGLQFKLGLWFMVVAGYLTPICAIIVFFRVYHYWTNKFPVEFMFDFVRVLKQHSVKNIKGAIKENKGILEAFSKYFGSLEKDYEEIIKSAFSSRVLYPFKCPDRIITAFLYITMVQGAFSIPILLTNGQDVLGLNWSYFFFACNFFAMGVNYYAYAITTVWTWILIGILVIIFLVCFCAIFSCGASGGQRKRYNY